MPRRPETLSDMDCPTEGCRGFAAGREPGYCLRCGVVICYALRNGKGPEQAKKFAAQVVKDGRNFIDFLPTEDEQTAMAARVTFAQLEAAL